MCIRYVRTDPRKERVLERLGYLYGEPTTGELFPGDVGSIIKADRRIEDAKWGLQPWWPKLKSGASDPNWGKKNAYNARSETIWEKPTFRTAIQKRRCLVVASGFYERAGGRWLLASPVDDEPLLIAALYEDHNSLTSIQTFTLVTTVPNACIEKAHDRMPVILSPDDAVRWLDLETPRNELNAFMIPCPDDRLTLEDAGPVSTKRTVALSGD